MHPAAAPPALLIILPDRRRASEGSKTALFYPTAAMSRHSVSVLSSSVNKRTNSRANRTRAAQDRPATRTLLSNLLVACSLLFLVTACVKPLVSPDLSAAWEMTPLDSVFLLLEVDESPVPVGGLEAALRNIHYPSEAWRQRIQGVVLVEFVVDE